SEFRFGDATPPPRPVPTAVRQTPTPPPVRSTPPRGATTAAAAPPPPAPAPIMQAPSAPLRLEDDILGSSDGGGSSSDGGGNGEKVDPYFKQVYDQFVSVKKSCNEPTAGLTYQKFADKLVKNRDDLMSKTGCREVRFTVYVKDGKAALKATPV